MAWCGLASALHLPSKRSTLFSEYAEGEDFGSDRDTSAERAGEDYLTDIMSIYSDNKAPQPRKDYSHLEPPLALPSRQLEPKGSELVNEMMPDGDSRRDDYEDGSLKENTSDEEENRSHLIPKTEKDGFDNRYFGRSEKVKNADGLS